MKNEQLELLNIKAQASLKIIDDKNSPLKSISPARAELRRIYAQLSSLSNISDQEKLSLNSLTLKCILNMFSSERAILSARSSNIDNYSKEEIKSWFLDAERILTELQPRGLPIKFDSDALDYYNFNLEKLGLEVEFYYYCLIDPNISYQQLEICTQLIQSVIAMLKLISSFSPDMLGANERELDNRAMYWFVKLLEYTQNYSGKSRLGIIPLVPFAKIKSYVDIPQYYSSVKAMWIELCVLIERVGTKLSYGFTADSRRILNQTSASQQILESNDELKEGVRSKESSPKQSGVTLRDLDLESDRYYLSEESSTSAASISSSESSGSSDSHIVLVAPVEHAISELSLIKKTFGQLPGMNFDDNMSDIKNTEYSESSSSSIVLPQVAFHLNRI